MVRDGAVFRTFSPRVRVGQTSALGPATPHAPTFKYRRWVTITYEKRYAKRVRQKKTQESRWSLDSGAAAGINPPVVSGGAVVTSSGVSAKQRQPLMDEPKITDYQTPDAGGKGSEIADEELIDELRRLERILGRRPSLNDNTKHGCYSATAYRNHFGSWSGALEQLGYNIDSPETSEASKDEVIEDICRVADGLGHVPTSREYDEHGDYSKTLFGHRDDWSWNRAVIDAGLFPQEGAPECRVGELIDEILDLFVEVGASPLTKEIVHHAPHSSHLYKSVFGSLPEMHRICGIPPRYRNGYYSPPENPHVDYGDNWDEKKAEALERDRWRCQDCGIEQVECRDKHNRSLHVHHIVKIRLFEQPENANFLENLITLCEECHRNQEGIRPDIDVGELESEVMEAGSL